MFWKKRSKQQNHQVPKQALVLNAYLAGAVVLISGKLGAPAARAGAQVFILGMADMLRQSENLPWDDFVAIYNSALDVHELLPVIPVDEFIKVVGEAVASERKIAQIMEEGARSIGMFVGEKDAQAPIDLSRAVLFAESNEPVFAAIRGAT